MTQIALITGATSGLGEAAAEALARKGYQVLIAGRDAERWNGAVRCGLFHRDGKTGGSGRGAAGTDSVQ